MSRWPRAVAAGWHPVAFSGQVRTDRAQAAMLMDKPLLLMRDALGVTVLEDRCPHRHVPLSRGRVIDGVVTCPYHGWRFGRGGTCLEVPGADQMGAAARAYPCVEHLGLVWTTIEAEPAAFPRLPDAMADAALDRFWWPLASSRADVLDALENHLDPAHPHHVHPWMVRSTSRRKDVLVSVRSGPWGAEAVYREQGVATGLIPWLIEGKRSVSIGRFYPPTIGEVAFVGRKGLQLSVTIVFQPITEGITRPWVCFASARGLLPAGVKALALKLVHLPVLFQDRRILAMQQDARRADGTRCYSNGPLDLLGPTIWRLANGEVEAERAYETTLRL